LSEPLAERRQCPTRVEGHDPLIAHWITAPTCTKRQGRNYHKCFDCVHREGAPISRVPRLSELEPAPRPLEKPTVPVPQAV